jgi:S-adenosylmethionine decarboxylase
VSGTVSPSPLHADAVGYHVLADLHGIDPSALRDAAALEALLVDAARLAGATVLSASFRHFGGEHGVTGVVLLAESHVTIHTWPELGFAALDAFMCGQARPHDAIDHIACALRATRVELHSQRRGE